MSIHQKTSVPTVVTLLLGMSTLALAHTPEQRRDFSWGAGMFLQPRIETSNAEDIKMDGPKATALKDPKDADEIKKKRMLLVGPEGSYMLGFHVYYDDTGVFPGPWEHPTIRYATADNTFGADLMMPDEKPIGVLNSPWMKIDNTNRRTASRHDFALHAGMNLITLKLDPDNKWDEFLIPAFEKDSEKKKISLEDNNTVTFAIELVTKLEGKPIPFPRK